VISEDDDPKWRDAFREGPYAGVAFELPSEVERETVEPILGDRLDA